MIQDEDIDPQVTDHHFWESDVELVRKKALAPDGKKFRYFDDRGIFNFVFMVWMYKWVRATAERYLDPYMLHPLPLVDQILIWQPILSRHISDGIASLEEWESRMGIEEKRAPKPVKYILWRAIWLTFWKRLLTILLLIVVINAIGMSVAVILHRLLNLLSEKDFNLMSLLSLALSAIVIELCKEIGMDHTNYYVQRLEAVMDSSIRVTIFQHGLCYRRNHFGSFSSHPDSCKSVVHSCSGENMCTYNPLFCPARRYKNNEVTPKMYALVLNDSHYAPYAVECASGLIDFLTAFIYGLILMSTEFNVNALKILIVSLSLVVCMFIVEIINGIFFKWYFGIRDNRIAKSEEVISSLHLIEGMSLDDIGHDVITETRNDELVFVLTRFFISLLNKVIFTVITCVDIIILINDFVGDVENSSDVKSINPSGLLASIFVLMKIVAPLYMLSFKLELLILTINASRRLELFFRTCSPNFYLPDNKFTGEVSLPEMTSDSASTQSLPKGLVVMFKKASFAWVNSRKDLLDKTGTTCLENLDFILNTGNLAIITGAQGSGKTNFVKAILGDMTLVDGSMAVLPLSTNMPIFYASQDVWIQKGTIRSNITFGHRFNEDVYNTVIKAIELEHDISTWEEGDMRKISEHGYSLSGGQRVRIGLARAIYAYLIYSKTNRDSGSQCTFLVILDDSFTNLDPFVARTIFRNLFSSKDGLLVKDDVATILTISKRILGECVSSESSTSFMDAPIYSLKDKTLIHDNMLSAFIDHQVGHLESPKTSTHYVESMVMPDGLRKLCYSDDYTRKGRSVLIQLAYSESPTVQHLYNRANHKSSRNENFNVISVYLRAAGWPIVVFFFFTFTFATLDNTKFIITSKICDSIVDYAREHGEASLEDIKDYSIIALRWIVALSISVMIGAIMRIVAMTKASFNVSRRIHEYCVNSVIVNNPVFLMIKKSIASVTTFLYMDTFYIDNVLTYLIHDASLLLIEAGVHLLTLLFLIPWSIPLVLLLYLVILRFIAYYFVGSYRKIGLARLETFNQINAVIETAISGLPIYRSFRKEWELVHSMVEHVEYNTRCLYFGCSTILWSSISLRCWLSPLALFILIFPLARSRYLGTDVKIGYYAMAYSIFLSVNGTFSNCLQIYCHLETSVNSIRRFENFVPTNTPVVFGKKRNIHQTDVIVDHSGSCDKTSDDNIKSSIRTRRYGEYAERRAPTCTGLKMLFFRHRVNILDVSRYVTPGHVRVQLDNVSVYVTSRNAQERYPILRNVTCSANASDIVGIVGRTGAGKSTLLSALQNLTEHREGSVLLDGCDLRDIPKAVTRQIIGVLPQLPFVFRGWTVRRFIDPRMLFDDIDIGLALENCGLLKFVEHLPSGKGLDTIILPEHYHKDMPKYYKRAYYGPSMKPHDSHSKNVNVDYGMALSNSQLRTLSVVRLVLYREFFKILLVDEPPEDELGEAALSNTVGIPIYELVRTYFQHCTTFIAAHDASVLRLCTSVWALHDGSLIKTCKTEDIVDSSSLSKIIEDCISQHTECSDTRILKRF